MSKDDCYPPITRRVFVQQGAGLLVAPWVLQLSACTATTDGVNMPPPPADMGSKDTSPGTHVENRGASNGPAPSDGPVAMDAGADASQAAPESEDGPAPLSAGAVLLGLFPGDGASAMKAALAHLDFSFLQPGDSVLIKVASNSGHPHPATTSPNGVFAMVEELKRRGAGRIVVADQAGVEHVRRSAIGRFSSTRERFEENGLAALGEVAELHFFDEGDWDSGYFSATLPQNHHWPRGLYLANMIREVDHVIYMPRISAHMLAGLTNAQKSAVGWLRDDSRHDMHNDAQDFFEKYAEINYTLELQQRLRLVVTLCEQIQLFGGPDTGTPYRMDPPLVLASTSLANHDAVATSVLVTLQNSSGVVPAGMLYNRDAAPLLNSLFAAGALVGVGDAGPWISESSPTPLVVHDFETIVSSERAVIRGWELQPGGRPASIDVRVAGEAMADVLFNGLQDHGGGLYHMA